MLVGIFGLAMIHMLAKFLAKIYRLSLSIHDIFLRIQILTTKIVSLWANK